MVEQNSRKLIAAIQREGWVLVGTTGSHHHFKHPTRPGKLTIPHPKRELPLGTVRAILKQAGLLE
ncbi:MULTISPECIES: type II toxin-antitoxin system HicA family toxin [Devosia]|uniref:YcfA-like protein n=1 Tax=Devosia equisanguinis TaxID=2490941 RepID=A0A447ICV7_9HYPH|nr:MULTISPECIES: type II toxin-antitoxin system HicA family toxin [Devosia]ODT47617.1 MAG: addiction module toxin, HicA family [Pelagibacterium sp. SCN 63-126]ODU86427.1 MAG: addiction module toxin, HicA family [Pelagibacterium sp. SCN 63-17]OJX42676.1 MAG: addiction module toxin, HicA family [Devosia sp. 63-57]VDS05300.1 YcfA-like protein [Devosia equisanguinis]